MSSVGCSESSQDDRAGTERTDDDATSDEQTKLDGGNASARDAARPSDASSSSKDAGPGNTREDAGTTDTGSVDTIPSGNDAGGAGPTTCNGKALPPRALGKSGPFAVGPESAGLPPYWPTDGWKTETLDKLGFDADKLAKAVDYKTAASSSEAVFIVRHGYVAAEKYFGRFTATSTHESYSIAKSFSSGLIGIAIEEKKLTSTDELVCKYYPTEWDCADMADARSRITIGHAMNLTTGLRWQEDWRIDASGPNDAISLTTLDTALARETVDEPGSKKRYSTGDPALLSGVLQKVTGMTAYAYAKQKIFDVIGTPQIRWNQDPQGRTTTYAGLQATARDYAKYGYLYLQGGSWDGKQVIPKQWVDKTTHGTAPCDDWNQWLWHVNPPVRLGRQDPACDSLYCPPTDFADLPPDAFFAEGVNGQFLFVVPSADLVVVRLATDMPGIENWDKFAREFLGAVLDAIL